MPKNQPSKSDPADPADIDLPGEEPAAPEATADRPAGEAVAAEQTPDTPELLRSELQEARDRALRMQAELENYRRRAAREMLDERRYANLPLMRDLLPVLDNMDRAIEAAETSHNTTGLLEGVKMVARQFEEVLQRHHCARIDALDELFDPHRHEAVSQQPSDAHPAGTVVQVVQPGFQLHDRVVRPAQVIVASEDRSERQDQSQGGEKESA